MNALLWIDEWMVRAAGALSRKTRLGGWRLADESITAALALLCVSEIMRAWNAPDLTARVLAIGGLVLYAALMHGARRRLRSDRREGGKGPLLRERPMRLVGLAIVVLLVVFADDLTTVVFALGFVCAVAQSAFKASVPSGQRPA